MSLSDELHSLAYTCASSSNSDTNLHSSNSLGWDSHDLGLLNPHTVSSLVMDENNMEAASFSPTESDVSTGYLEDALVEFTSKRRRLLLYASDEYLNYYTQPNHDHHLLQSYWSSCCTWGVGSESSFDWMNQIYNMNYDSVSADDPISSSPKSRISEDQTNMNQWTEMKTPELEAFSTHYYEDPNSSSSSSKNTLNAEFLALKEPTFSLDCKPASGEGCDTRTTTKKKKKRVVYPFAMVKPGGEEGDITLKDINKRMLMAPTRPVRHPVGDFACRPCVSGDGTKNGLSGKAVVALTRIHTQGRRGTITIIRTKA